MILINGAEAAATAALSSVAAESTLIRAVVGVANAATNATSIAGRVNRINTRTFALLGASDAATNSTSMAGRVNNINLNAATIIDALIGVEAVYPTQTVGVAIPSLATAWKTGAFTNVAATNALAAAINIRGINIEGISTSGVYQLTLAEGTAGATVIGRYRFAMQSTAAVLPHIKTWSKEIDANKAIKAKLECSKASIETVTLSLTYVL